MAAHTGNPTFAKETIYAYISDGGIQEEISQGGARIAATLGLDNLIMFYDSNDIQLSTETKDVMTEDTAAKYRALGWEVIEIVGNDAAQIRQALDAAQKVEGKPTLIIGKCIMGKGALKEDGSSYEANPEKAAAQAEWFSGKAPKVDWSKVQQKDNDATRSASAACLGVLAEQVPNMICASADLSNSDKTDGFLKKTHSFTKGDFTGAFFQAGVAELTMACCCIGMALHGGVIPACGTYSLYSLTI